MPAPTSIDPLGSQHKQEFSWWMQLPQMNPLTCCVITLLASKGYPPDAVQTLIQSGMPQQVQVVLTNLAFSCGQYQDCVSECSKAAYTQFFHTLIGGNSCPTSQDLRDLPARTVQNALMAPIFTLWSIVQKPGQSLSPRKKKSRTRSPIRLYLPMSASSQGQALYQHVVLSWNPPLPA
jgi:hypothetical protein